MDRLSEAAARLQEARSRSDSIIISYSGGKDSLVVTDMCVRTFPKVDAFIMEFVPGMAIVEERIEYAAKRWGLAVRRYPHWSSLQAIRAGVFCDTHWTVEDDLPEIKLLDIYGMVRKDTGMRFIATGAKRADGIWRRRYMKMKHVSRDVVMPIAGFQKVDVVSYLQAMKIPMPGGDGKVSSGVDLAAPSILWLHDNHPDDFKKLCAVFPYAEAVVWRRKFHGEV